MPKFRMEKVKVLNLYAGIGGNRKLWPDEEMEVTAIENNYEIAQVYRDFFPQDQVIVCDAHQYLLDHFEEYDFIWSSPPCPTHSRVRKHLAVERGQNEPVYPSMDLYQEILFLKHHFKGKWVVENVVAYYEPLIKAQEVGSHYYWSNFIITQKRGESRKHNSSVDELQERKGFDLAKIKCSIEKRILLRNCVEPELGLHIYKCAFKEKQREVKDYE